MQTRRFPASLLPALLCASLFGCGDDGDDSATGPALEATLADAVPLALDAVILQGSDTFLALLSSADGDSLSLPVNRCQADVIAAALGGVVFPRPMTHDLFATIADSLELPITHVLLDVAGDAATEGYLLLAGPRTRQSLPTSVGDALAIAQQISVPLLGTRALLDHHERPTRLLQLFRRVNPHALDSTDNIMSFHLANPLEHLFPHKIFLQSAFHHERRKVRNRIRHHYHVRHDRENREPRQHCAVLHVQQILVPDRAHRDRHHVQAPQQRDVPSLPPRQHKENHRRNQKQP